MGFETEKDMCFLCDGGSFDELHRLIDDAIDEPGWFVQSIEAGPDVPPWAYTIGLSERFGHPELVVVDAHCFRCGANLLQAVADDVAAGVVYRPGSEVRHDGRVVARIGDVHADEWATDRFNGWLGYYDSKSWKPPRAQALQVVWSVQGVGLQDEAWNERWEMDCLATSPYERASTWRPVRRANRRERRAMGRSRRRPSS
jgi:hypothetical protein